MATANNENEKVDEVCILTLSKQKGSLSGAPKPKSTCHPRPQCAEWV